MAGTEYLLSSTAGVDSLTQGERGKGDSVMNDALASTNNQLAQAAKSELKCRIRRIRLEDALVELACGLCMEEVPVETAFLRIQDKALEKLVPLLDTKILGNAEAVQGCLELVAEESERVAWEALKKGTEMLEDGLSILEDGELELPEGGYIN